MSSWLRCWRISLTNRPASPVPSPLAISAIVRIPTIERIECMHTIAQIAPEKRWRTRANTWCVSPCNPRDCEMRICGDSRPGLGVDPTYFPYCGVRTSRDPGPGLAVIPTCSPAASTYAQARPPNSISNHDHSL